MIDVQLIEKIDDILPQTQCGQCGHSGCRPYAEALAAGNDDINRCPPGGEDGIRQLAQLLGKPFLPFDPAGPQPKPKAVAVIDETSCIGCTLCIRACPVDAIIGASKQMHTVISDECTGCELCLPPCPVDCISMQPAAVTPPEQAQQVAHHARERYRFHQFRLERDKQEKAQRLAERSANTAAQSAAVATPASDKAALIQAAMARAAAQQPSAPKPAAPTNTLDEAKRAIIQAAMERAAAQRAARDQTQSSDDKN